MMSPTSPIPKNVPSAIEMQGWPEDQGHAKRGEGSLSCLSLQSITNESCRMPVVALFLLVKKVQEHHSHVFPQD